MRRPLAACRRLGAACLAVATVVAAACGGVEELGPSPLLSGEPPPTSRLAQIHVVVQPPGNFTGDEPALEVSAVFAQYRGFDETAARARLDLRPLPQSRLRPGQCVASDQLLAADEAGSKDSGSKDSGSKDSLSARELLLLDAGNLSVRLGEATVDVPLTLLPDLVPTVSGVSYSQISDFLPAGAWPTAEPAPTELAIRVGGEGDDLPGFTLQPPLPEPVALAGEADPERRELRLDWRPDGRGEPVVLRFISLIGGETVGDEVTCLADDDGSFRVDIDELRVHGLAVDVGRALRISATRAARVPFDVGEFTGADAIVETRTYLVLGT